LVRPALVRTSVRGLKYIASSLTPHTVHPAFEDGTDTGFRNVGQLQLDGGEISRRKYTIFKSLRKFEIKNTEPILVILAKHWLWLPDDGFLVNRNMLEQPL